MALAKDWMKKDAFYGYKMEQDETAPVFLTYDELQTVMNKEFTIPRLCLLYTSFYKDLLQKIGVEMQVFKVGTYKSAVEPFIATEMSPANREQVTVFINSIWGQVTEGVAASRSLPVDSLNAYADRMLMFYPAEESVKCGLADTLIYHNEDVYKRQQYISTGY